MAADEATYTSPVDRFDTLDDASIAAAHAFARGLSPRRRFDIVMPVYDPPVEFLFGGARIRAAPGAAFSPAWSARPASLP